MGNPGKKFEIIREIVSRPENVLNIKDLCEIAGVSRSGYYNWINSEGKREEREEQDRKDFDLILEAYTYRGYDKGAKGIRMRLLHMDPPVQMNEKKIRRLMRKYGLICPIRGANPYRRMAKALRSNTVAANLVNREFKEHGPRQILLTDITYIPYNNTFAFLSTILDAYTRQILAYVVSPNMKEEFVLETINRLVENHGIELNAKTIIHSDQGAHYTCLRFIDILKNKNLRQSMSRKGNCWDNAPQESFFGHMKDEVDFSGCKTFEEVKALIDDWMDYYNNERYQWQLAKLSPNEYYSYITSGIYPVPLKHIEAIKEKEAFLIKKTPVIPLLTYTDTNP